jgi:hypothetical protein
MRYKTLDIVKKDRLFTNFSSASVILIFYNTYVFVS